MPKSNYCCLLVGFVLRKQTIIKKFHNYKKFMICPSWCAYNVYGLLHCYLSPQNLAIIIYAWWFITNFGSNLASKYACVHVYVYISGNVTRCNFTPQWIVTFIRLFCFNIITSVLVMDLFLLYNINGIWQFKMFRRILFFMIVKKCIIWKIN